MNDDVMMGCVQNGEYFFLFRSFLGKRIMIPLQRSYRFPFVANFHDSASFRARVGLGFVDNEYGNGIDD